jgi:heat shock protein HtpX
MQWDLWNPWARYYELHSSHPLPAKRIQALGQLAQSQGQAPLVNFNLRQPESYWDEFAVDLGVMLLPLAGLLLAVAYWTAPAAADFASLTAEAGKAVTGPSWLVGLVFPAVGWLIKILYQYRGGYFPDFTVSGLLRKVKVSGVRPVPCRVRGKVIGRGIPGLLWSEDMVLQDATGYIFLDYRQPLAIFEWLFGLFRTPGLIGQEVEVEGWYRRSPVPFVEMKKLTVGTGFVTHRAYVYPLKLALAVALLVVGLAGFFL